MPPRHPLSLHVGSSKPPLLPTHIIALRSFANVFFSIRDMATWSVSYTHLDVYKRQLHAVIELKHTDDKLY